MSIAIAALLVLGLVFLMRDAEATEWIRKSIKIRAVHGRAYAENSTAIDGPDGVSEVDGRLHRIARFIDALLSCSPCCAAWAAPPAIGMVYALGAMSEVPAALCMVFVIGPVAAVGLLHALTLLSPAQMIGILASAAARKKRTEEK